MIKIEALETAGWGNAIYGMRLPMLSMDKSDSYENHEVLDCEECPFYITTKNLLLDCSTRHCPHFCVGERDLDLMQRLYKAGTEHRKFMRQIFVSFRATMPIYLAQEWDTYKVGTTRDSSSFMHKGTSKMFTIDDFDVDERIAEILRPLPKKEHPLIYPYETDEYREYEANNGRKYKVFKNGKLIRCEFDCIDNYGSGRKRHFGEGEATLYQGKGGYWNVKLSGRDGGHIMLHRMVAAAWLGEKPSDKHEINHIDGNKGNNSVENLEWVTRKENINKAIAGGLYDSNKSLKYRYNQWKPSCVAVLPKDRMMFKNDCFNMKNDELVEKYGLSLSTVNSCKFSVKHNEHEDLFQFAYVWERTIGRLNSLREIYLETKDDKVFEELRAILPMGYKVESVYTMNYEVIANMIRQRRNHRLSGWRTFCECMLNNLPYLKEIMGE